MGGFFKGCRRNKKKNNNNKMSSDMASVPDPTSVRMYYGSGTVALTASQWHHTRQAIDFSQDDVMVILMDIKYDIISNSRCRQLNIDAYLLEEI